MKYLYTRLLCCLFAVSPALAQPVLINEIMFHPPPAVPEDTSQEWIELFNAGTNAVDITAWHFDAGVSFAFPPSTVLPAGGYIVVAASLTNFQAHFPGVANVLGDWAGRLSNTRELIRLVDANGETVNAVQYADGGDWAVRQRIADAIAGLPSWDWVSTADGQSRSLELINPALPNSAGENWAPSQAAFGTPGAPNSVRLSDVAPLILEVAHFPAIPKSTDSVTITARVIDERSGPGSGVTVSLLSRNATSTSPLAFTSTPMFDDGAHNDGLANDGIFGVVRPAQPNGTVVEFYVQSSDGVNTRTWPAPTLDGVLTQSANALYQVDDEDYSGNQEILRLVLTGADRQTLLSINPNSDAEMNTTLISVDSSGVSHIRYSSGVRIRGAGSRSRPTKNYRVNVPTDRPWHNLTAINLNSQYPHAQVVGSIIAQKAGLVAANARFVQLRVNGVNLARSGPPSAGDGSSWGVYNLVEPINNEWAAVHFPTDPNGNVYRASSGGHTADLSYQGTDPFAYTSRGYSKTANASENDWGDLINLVDVLNNTAPAQYANVISNRMNVRQWMTYFATFSLMEYSETALGSGEGDDYSLYRGLADTRFKIVGHDFDTVFGEGDTAGNINESIFVAADATDQPAVDRFMKFPAFAPIFYEELHRLATGVFSAAELGSEFDQFLTGVVTAPVLTAMKTFGTARTAAVLNQIPQVIRITNTLALVNGYPTTVTPTVSLTGSANAIQTRSVRVNGLPADWTPWRGTWSIVGVPLLPGINRVLVQAFDANGREIERNTADTQYDDGTVADITANITADTTWTAAGGPYRVANSISIQAGATLTIAAGTTVYLAQGANLTVANGGRLVAEGTDTSRIRFTRVPGSTASWGGLTVNGGAGSPETRLAYAHFEFNNATAIHAADGTLFLDHLTFGSTEHQYVSLDRSSFVVQDCIFPSATAEFEPVHGTGGIKAGGRGIFLRNFLGRPTGYNDSIDFTGGNRPGPIVQFINNVFIGSDDDILDLDSTDAWVEGNIFLHAHRRGSPDSSSAISGGADNADTSEVTIIGNLFYDVDQVANAKQGNFFTLLNNTIVHQTSQGSQDTETAVIIVADEGTVEGAGMYLEGNIIYDAEKLVRNQTAALVTFTNNLMALPWAGPGGGNVNAEPSLRHVPQLAETTNFTTFSAVQVVRDWFSLSADSAARGTGPNGADLGGAIALGVSLSRDPAGTVAPDAAAFHVGLNRTGQGIPVAGFPDGSGYTHYRFRLDGGVWSAETPIATPIALSGLAGGAHRLDVSGKRDSGYYQDDPVYGSDAVVTSAQFSIEGPPPARVLLNEILAANRTAFPQDGRFPDAIELYNAGGAAIDLGGWGLTDEAAKKFKFLFAPGTVLPAGGYLVLLADDATGPGVHLGFALEQQGETVSLYNSAGVLADQVQFGIQLVDLSIGRDSAGAWTLGVPTLGAANQARGLADPHGLKLNEWLANSSSLYAEDFIELYNPSGAPVNLGGLFLTDEILGWPAQHQVTPLTFMGAGAHFVFLADGHEEDGANHLNFQLAADRGSIGLLDANTNLIDCVFYGPQAPDISEGRRPSGASEIVSFATPTPGAPNPAVLGSVTVTSFALSLMSTSAVWKYEQSNVDLGTGWIAPNYNDSAWASGPGILGFDNDFNPQPFATLMTIANNKLTFYYRTTFVMPTNPAGFRLEGGMYLDDGAVIYLNGSEATRIRMPNGQVTFTTRANTTVDNFTRETVTIPANGLVQGVNSLAVEVHQASTTSGDVAWGLELSAVRSVTNRVVFGIALNEVMARNASFVEAGGTNLADWVELYNPSTNTFNLSGLSLSDDLEQPRRWVFPAGVTVAGGGYLVVRFDENAPPSTSPGPVLNTGFSLNGEAGDGVYLFGGAALTNALLDSVAFGIQVPDYTIARVPDGIGAWKLSLPTPGTANIPAALGSSSSLVINEWLANPSGNDKDFLELYNPLPQPVDLSPLFLSDSLTNRTRSPIRALSFIGSGDAAFVRFVADSDPGAGADHVNFRLGSSGETIALFSASQQLIQSISFGPQQNGVSEGRFPDGSTNIVQFRGTSTPGRSNLLPLDSVAISEVLTHTDPPFEDAIELVNVSAVAVDLSGWWLSDQQNDPKRFRIPPGTILAPGARRVFYEYQFNPDFSGRPPGFALSSSQGDEVFLSTADAAGTLTGFRAGVKFGASANGVSFGRHVTSVDVDFTALRERTFGADSPATVEEFRSGAGRTNAGPLVGPVVMSELMYHPPDVISAGVTNDNTDHEFIELLNVSASEVPLFDPNYATNTWRLRDAVDFEFRQGVSLPAGGRLVVVGFDPATNAAALSSFRTAYGLDDTVPIHGPWRGRLANDGENIELYKPDPPEPAGRPDAGFVPYVLVDKVKYADSAPWPALADGTGGGVGLSLHRRNDGEYGNDPVNWFAAAPTPGGAAGLATLVPPTILSLTPDLDVTPGGTATLTATAGGGGVLSYQWRFNGFVIPGAVGATLQVSNFQSTNAGVYSIVVMNPAGAASASTRARLRSMPFILRQPQNTIVIAGNPAVFSVVAGGSEPLSYQWLKNGSPIPEATSAAFFIAQAQAADAAGYRVVIANAFGTVTSTVAVLELNSPPIILTQPRSTNVFIGTSAILSVGAVGSAPLRYQWRFNGANIQGATSTSYTLANIQLANAGDYSVLVSNAVGTVLSAPATVAVFVPPVITIIATDPTASESSGNPGQVTFLRTGPTDASLAVNFATGGSAIAGSDYNGLFGPIIIPSGTNAASLAVNVIDDAVLEGNETVIVTVTGGPGYVVGSPASATVTIFDNDNLPPTVTITSPGDGFVTTFPGVVPLAAIAFDGDGIVARVEYFDNGTNRIGQATVFPYALNWTNATSGVHSVTAVATDNLGSTGNSVPVIVTINAPPTVAVTSPPSGSILAVGSDIPVVADAADSDGSIILVEFFQGTSLLGTDATAPFTFLWTAVPAGEYTLTARATDNRGVARVSAPVVITVGTPPARFGDNFSSRGVMGGFTNILLGSSSNFTREAGEPRHDNRNGTHSGWITWTAPVSGLCRMDTFGSAFDTVLAVYTNAVLTELGKVISNDDASQDTSESQLAFNAVAGTVYQVALDGFSSNAFGNFVFHMSTPNPFAIFLTQPQSQVTTQGLNVTFSVSTAGPGPQTYQWRFNNGTIQGATNNVLVRNNVGAGNQGNYVVVVSNPFGAVTSAVATLTVRTVANIATQPAGLAVQPGDNAAFFVRATGFGPFTYQWRFNGNPIPGATATNLVLTGVFGRNEGAYSVVISNPIGSVTSRDALLQVVDGLLTYLVEPVLPITNTWRYHVWGEDLGTAWRQLGYDDTGWSNGVGLFGLETTPQVYPEPFRTTFPIIGTNGPITNFYFRTDFTLANPRALLGLLATAYVDDGAVWYINGREAARLRLNNAIPVDEMPYAVISTNLNTEGVPSFLVLPATNAVAGTNFLCVELHQGAIPSSDAVFGMSLDSLTAVTNAPAVVMSDIKGGNVTLTITGIPGRDYSLDVSEDLLHWSALTAFTNFNGTFDSFVTPFAGSGNRFYRGRVGR